LYSNHASRHNRIEKRQDLQLFLFLEKNQTEHELNLNIQKTGKRRREADITQREKSGSRNYQESCKSDPE